jgi:Fic family protein
MGLYIICSTDFLCWIHGEFYTRMPPEFGVVRDDKGNETPIDPGKIRERDVIVGQHVPPTHETLSDFTRRFEQVYEPEKLQDLTRIIAAAASHHRLAWIHPFLDGNGRVTRLFTQSYMIRTGLDSHGLWAITRGLSRNRERYMSALIEADQPRAGNIDGRGNLSDKGLTDFCLFFMETALDQVRFMSDLLDLTGLEQRITGYIERRVALKELQPEAKHITREALLSGEVSRGEVPRITGRAERTARRILEQLLNDGLMTSSTPKGPVRLTFPAKAIGYYFPRLYPEGVEVVV